MTQAKLVDASPDDRYQRLPKSLARPVVERTV